MGTLVEIFKRLIEAKVEFSLIGGLASRHYGVTLVTEDMDICARFTEANLRRIEAALKDLHPRHRLTTNRLPLELTDDLCRELKNMYLTTDLGTLDCLSQVAGVGDFDAVLKKSVMYRLPYGEFPILSMDALIDAKLAVGRPHDLMTVAQLRAIKEKKEQQKELF